MIAFYNRFRGRVLLVGGLALVALVSLLLTSYFIKSSESANVAAPVTSAVKPAHASAAPSLPTVSKDAAQQQIKFVTCLCRDHQGYVWIGTEDQGLWRYDPTAPVAADYVHFAAADGPGDDNIYALACDKSGRVWAGTLNHGVAVFNGQRWGRYAKRRHFA